MKPAPIPGVRTIRNMREGDILLYPFRPGKPRPDVQAQSIFSKIEGGEYSAAVRLLIDPNGETLQKVCIVTCIVPAPPPVFKKRGRPRKAVPGTEPLREEYTPQIE